MLLDVYVHHIAAVTKLVFYRRVQDIGFNNKAKYIPLIRRPGSYSATYWKKL